MHDSRASRNGKHITYTTHSHATPCGVTEPNALAAADWHAAVYGTQMDAVRTGARATRVQNKVSTRVRQRVRERPCHNLPSARDAQRTRARPCKSASITIQNVHKSSGNRRHESVGACAAPLRLTSTQRRDDFIGARAVTAHGRVYF